jgi:nucleoid DNA-binding protein
LQFAFWHQILLLTEYQTGVFGQVLYSEIIYIKNKVKNKENDIIMTKTYATRTELVTKLAEKHDVKKSVLEAIVADVNPTIVELVKSGDFDGYRDMGYVTYDVVDVPERTHRNPQDGSEVVKPAHQKVKAKAGAKFAL